MNLFWKQTKKVLEVSMFFILLLQMMQIDNHILVSIEYGNHNYATKILRKLPEKIAILNAAGHCNF